MVVMVFDTETTSLDKPFCYNVGYVLWDSESGEIVKEREYVIEQVWSNLPLFQSAYYAEKRPLYVKDMRARKTKLEKWGYVCQQMIRDIKSYEVVCAYAYNSPFDEKVFDYNCEWFKTQNPFDTIPIHDIKGLANTFITNTDDYKDFCEEHKRFTDSGNYSATAETVYQYILQDIDFVEDHTALSDSKIETSILIDCLYNGGELDKDYPTVKVLTRYPDIPFTVKVDKEVIYQGTYKKKYIRNGTYSFTTKI